MINYIEKVSANVRLQEGSQVIEQLLMECYLKPGISTKGLSRMTLLPVPVVVAIKKEMIKAGALEQNRGVRCTNNGKSYIENECGFSGLNLTLYQKLMNLKGKTDLNAKLGDILKSLKKLFASRPQVNVVIDQSKCTPETSLRRAILCLQHRMLIGKRILCVGDDDLVSVSLGFLLKRLFPKTRGEETEIVVVDLDHRFLQFIRDIADQEGLPIKCHRVDLRKSLPKELHEQYDCFFTDPPYTPKGMNLFISRGVSALKKKKGLPIFCSFAHKSPDITLEMQRELVRTGLIIGEILPGFNEYEGSQMIGNKGQMIVLKTTGQTFSSITDSFDEAIYTGEVKRTVRSYRCKGCGKSILIGFKGDYKTIEELKNHGCPDCKQGTFIMANKRIIQHKI